MGCTQSNSQVFDQKGQPLFSRKCIVFISPPSFETSKFIQSKPDKLNYRFISVGKLIRDEINKRTHYSKIIMENLAKNKKINDKILEVLLKNVALQGNFIIQFCPKDNEDLIIWRKFLNQVQVQMVVIINPLNHNHQSQPKILLDQKMKSYENDIKNVRTMFKEDLMHYLDNDTYLWDTITKSINISERTVIKQK